MFRHRLIELTKISPYFQNFSNRRIFLFSKSNQSDKLNVDDPSTQVNPEEQKWNQEKAELTEKLSDFEDKYKRALAEAENVRKRMTRQVEDAKSFGIQSFCKDILDVADVLTKATTSVPKEDLSVAQNSSLKQLYDGLCMTEKEILHVFNKHGLKRVDPPLGSKFDPNFHEAIFMVPVSQPVSTSNHDPSPDTIAVVNKVGYELKGRPLRPALVGVYKK